ncbi:unnamed protein product [Urochloa humidicola]
MSACAFDPVYQTVKLPQLLSLSGDTSVHASGSTRHGVAALQREREVKTGCRAGSCKVRAQIDLLIFCSGRGGESTSSKGWSANWLTAFSLASCVLQDGYNHQYVCERNHASTRLVTTISMQTERGLLIYHWRQ